MICLVWITVKCDLCEAEIEWDGVTSGGDPSEEEILEQARQKGWRRKDGKDICRNHPQEIE